MSKELDLDSLRDAWQSQMNEKKFSSDEIFAMLKRKSSSSVKWIFMISLTEQILVIVMYIFMFSNFSVSDYHNHLLEQMGYWAIIYEVISFIIYGATFLFIYIFFRSYRRIHVQDSIRELSKDIINFRKVVNYFIYFNLIVVFVVSWIFLIPMISQNPELMGMDWTSATGIGFIVGILLSFAALLGAFWLYYYLVYGTFQRRLKRNLKELDALD